jgi:predicted neutral ceramidase superfamily lipid hydrolase
MNDRDDPGQQERQEAFLARTSPAWRETPEGNRAMGGGGYAPSPVERTPDADDIVDAMRIRARIIEAGDRRTAAVLLRAATYIRELELALEQSNKENRNADA